MNPLDIQLDVSTKQAKIPKLSKIKGIKCILLLV